MKKAGSALAVAVVALGGVLGFAITTGAAQSPWASAAAVVNTSGNISLLPARGDVTYAPLAADAVRVAADQAVATAEARLNLPPSALDSSVGVVRAMISVRGSSAGPAKAWIVTVDDPVRSPMTGTLYRKVCIAVDADTGAFLYAYAVDPA